MCLFECLRNVLPFVDMGPMSTKGRTLRTWVHAHAEDSRDTDLDVNARKIKGLFYKEVQLARDNGTLKRDSALFALMHNVCVMWQCETEAVEGVNNIIAYNVRKAPSALLPLINARCGITKELQLGAGPSDV